MKPISHLLFFIYCFSLSSSVLAEEKTENRKQWSISLLTGSSEVTLNQSNINSQDLITPGFEVDYKINQQFGMKFGSKTGLNFGSFTSAIFGSLFNIEIEDYSFQKYYVAATAKSEGDVHLFGSLGVARINEKINITNSSNDISRNTTKPYWEVGAGWDFSDNFGVGLSYSDTNAELAEISTVQFKIKFEF